MSAGSEEAFGTLFHFYRDKLYTYLFRLSQSREAAEDAVHDVFLKIWELREKLGAIDNFNAYIYRMAQNHAFTGFRRMAKETLVLAELQREQDGSAAFEGEDRISRKEVLDFIREAVNKLTPQQKQVFLMSRQQGLRHEEIAGRLHISIHTVKNHMVEALRLLREEMAKSYGPRAVALYVMYHLTFS